MNYLSREWDNYRYRRHRLSLFALVVTEDLLRLLRVPWQALRPIWFLRERLSEGRTRKLLRPVVKHWAKNGIYEVHYFDCGNRVLIVTLGWGDIRLMKGYSNDVQ